jgi:hypothetical protein
MDRGDVHRSVNPVLPTVWGHLLRSPSHAAYISLRYGHTHLPTAGLISYKTPISLERHEYIIREESKWIKSVILVSHAIRLNVNCAVIDTSLLRANHARKGNETNACDPEWSKSFECFPLASNGQVTLQKRELVEIIYNKTHSDLDKQYRLCSSIYLVYIWNNI